MGTLARHGRTEVVTEASADGVWRVISDVTRVGEWSDECQGARWQDGATSAAVGVRFRGRNRSGFFRWSRSCVFTTVEAPRKLAWRTAGQWGRVDSSEWHIVLEPVEGGTRIVQTYDVVRLAPALGRVYWLLIKAHRDRRAALVDDLHRLAVLATREARLVAPAAFPRDGDAAASG